MDKVKIGIVGFGNMGRSHSRFIAEGQVPGATVAAVCDINPLKLEAAKEILDEKCIFTEAEEMYKSGLWMR